MVMSSSIKKKKKKKKKKKICICESKSADQMSSKCIADQHLCFRYTESVIPLLLKFKISSFSGPSSVVVQASLCQSWSKS